MCLQHCQEKDAEINMKAEQKNGLHQYVCNSMLQNSSGCQGLPITQNMVNVLMKHSYFSKEKDSH
ncbi:hypothetical protein EXN66_Car006578 [Channa argus]|uniref:Uncharacterized protein n=1 Tax=Channa argus TaxID=215402 RepID=A0A6G1PL81_CHAAH|nr:hypothetical protein EXN66_Car006578 [Channa argus]